MQAQLYLDQNQPRYFDEIHSMPLEHLEYN
jgi:hypothetical protein